MKEAVLVLATAAYRGRRDLTDVIRTNVHTAHEAVRHPDQETTDDLIPTHYLVSSNGA